VLETDTGEERVLRSGSAGEVQGRDYWGSRWAGVCSTNLQIAGPRPLQPPRICRTALTRVLLHQRTSESVACSTIHPPTDQGFARSDAASDAAKRQQPVERLDDCAAGAERCELAAGWDAGGAPTAGSSRRLSRADNKGLDGTRRYRGAEKPGWRHGITRPHLLYHFKCDSEPNLPNLPSAADAAPLARPRLETLEHLPSQRQDSGRASLERRARMKLSATTPHSISHHRCLSARPASGAGFIMPAHHLDPRPT
jgi:hypothetical protein